MECEHTDAGDPWCIIYDQEHHRIVLHIARIERRYVAVWPREERSAETSSMTAAVERRWRGYKPTRRRNWRKINGLIPKCRTPSQRRLRLRRFSDRISPEFPTRPPWPRLQGTWKCPRLLLDPAPCCRTTIDALRERPSNRRRPLRNRRIEIVGQFGAVLALGLMAKAGKHFLTLKFMSEGKVPVV